MAFKSLVEQARKRKYWRGRDDTIAFSERHQKGGETYLAFSIGPNIVDSASFINGDKVDILWDPEDRMGIIRRDNSIGRMLKVSQSGRARIVLKWSEGMPRPRDGKLTHIKDIQVKNGELMFDFPNGKEESE